jgi:hypothetical protein
MARVERRHVNIIAHKHRGQHKRRNSLTGLAMIIAKKVTASDPEQLEQKLFQQMCDNAELQGGPLSTAEIEKLATKLLPAAIAERQARSE